MDPLQDTTYENVQCDNSSISRMSSIEEISVFRDNIQTQEYTPYLKMINPKREKLDK